MGNCQSVKELENKKIKYKKKSIPKSLKKQVWDTWIGSNIGATKCLCCRHEEIRQIEFHCGHIISEVMGGQTNVNNLRPICAQCNLSMGSMNMNEFKKKFFK
jgi:5-methylcytosine-specific restriction endonuclease McrA